MSAGLASATAANVAKGRTANAAKPKIIVLAWTDTIPFFSAMQKGVAAAAANLGANVKYIDPGANNGNNAGYTQLLKTALSQHPDALIVDDFFPTDLDGILKQAAAKIPVIFLDQPPAPNLPKALWVGSSNPGAGVAAGKQFLASGYKHVLDVDDCPGTAACVQVSNALKRTLGHGGGDMALLDGTPDEQSNPTAMQQAIAGELVSHKNVNAIEVNANEFAPAAAAISASGRHIALGVNGLSVADLQGVTSGKALFVIDPQVYLQGYYSVLAAYQRVKFGFWPAADISTGPYVLTKTNATQALKIDQQYGGVRG